MTPIETALIVLIIVWSIIFIIFGVAMFIILLGVKKGIDKINSILDDAHTLTSGVSRPIQAATNTLMGLVGKKLKKHFKD